MAPRVAGAGTAPWQAQAHPGPRLCPSPGPVAWGGLSLCPSGSPGRPAERREGTRARWARQRRGGGRSSASRAGSWVATRGQSAAQVGAAGGLSVVARALRPRRRPAGAKLAGSARAGRPLRFGAAPLLPFCASDALAAVPLGPTSGNPRSPGFCVRRTPRRPRLGKINAPHFSEPSSRKNGLQLPSLIFNLHFINFF